MTSCSRPASWAFLASVCERRANSSCSTLETPNAAARRSALWPMVSDVENSATAGSYGHIVAHRPHDEGLHGGKQKLLHFNGQAFVPLEQGEPSECFPWGSASGRASWPCWEKAWSSSSCGCDGSERQTWIPLLLPRLYHTDQQQSDQQLRTGQEYKKMSTRNKCANTDLMQFYASSNMDRERFYLRSLPGWMRCRPWWQCELESCQKIQHPRQPGIRANSEGRAKCTSRKNCPGIKFQRQPSFCVW